MRNCLPAAREEPGSEVTAERREQELVCDGGSIYLCKFPSRFYGAQWNKL